MEEVMTNELVNMVGGKDNAGCALYLLEAGLVAMAGGMAFGPVGFGAVVGFLWTVPNPCR
jgi:hypothetical protein